MWYLLSTSFQSSTVKFYTEKKKISLSTSQQHTSRYALRQRACEQFLLGQIYLRIIFTIFFFLSVTIIADLGKKCCNIFFELMLTGAASEKCSIFRFICAQRSWNELIDLLSIFLDHADGKPSAIVSHTNIHGSLTWRRTVKTHQFVSSRTHLTHSRRPNT